MGYFKRILNNCDEVSLLALKSKEENIPTKQRLEMQFHIFFCRCCKNFIKQSSLIDVSLKEYFKELYKNPLVKASDDFKSRMKEQLK